MRLPWVWILLSVVGLGIAVMVYRQVVEGKIFGSTHLSTPWLCFIVIIYLVIFFLLSRVHLSVKVCDLGIAFRFFPFHFKEKYIPFRDIKMAEVRYYRPIYEFGGWGIRSKGKITSYTISGRKGIELHLNSSKSILIGTQNQEDFAAALRAKGVFISHTNFK